jgi:hypothetical protein
MGTESGVNEKVEPGDDLAFDPDHLDAKDAIEFGQSLFFNNIEFIHRIPESDEEILDIRSVLREKDLNIVSRRNGGLTCGIGTQELSRLLRVIPQEVKGIPLRAFAFRGGFIIGTTSGIYAVTGEERPKVTRTIVAESRGIAMFDMTRNRALYLVNGYAVYLSIANHPFESYAFSSEFTEFTPQDVAAFESQAQSWNPAWRAASHSTANDPTPPSAGDPETGQGGYTPGGARDNQFPVSNRFDFVSIEKSGNLNTYFGGRHLIFNFATLYNPTYSYESIESVKISEREFDFRGWQIDLGEIFLFTQKGIEEEATRKDLFISEEPTAFLRASEYLTYATTKGMRVALAGLYLEDDPVNKPVMVSMPSDNDPTSYSFFWIEKDGEPVLLLAGEHTTYRVNDIMEDLMIYKCSFSMDRDYRKRQQFVIKIEKPRLTDLISGVLNVKRIASGENTGELEVPEESPPPPPPSEEEDEMAAKQAAYDKLVDEELAKQGIPESVIGGLETLTKGLPINFMSVPAELRPKVTIAKSELDAMTDSERNLELKALSFKINIVFVRSLKTYYPGEYPLDEAQTPNEIFKIRQKSDRTKKERETLAAYESWLSSPHERAIWFIYGEEPYKNNDFQKVIKEFGYDR